MSRSFLFGDNPSIFLLTSSKIILDPEFNLKYNSRLITLLIRFHFFQDDPTLFIVISSPEPKAWLAYSVVLRCVCVSTFSNISFETTGPIEAKFHVEPPWDGGTKVCSNGK